MTKNHWMYIALGAAAIAAYLYFDERKILKGLKGVSGLPADLQKRVDKIKA